MTSFRPNICDAHLARGWPRASDLNYRIDLSDTDIRAMLTPRMDGDYGVRHLVAYDQVGSFLRTQISLPIFFELRKAIQSGRAFSDFLEDPISHLPCVFHR